MGKGRKAGGGIGLLALVVLMMGKRRKWTGFSWWSQLQETLGRYAEILSKAIKDDLRVANCNERRPKEKRTMIRIKSDGWCSSTKIIIFQNESPGLTHHPYNIIRATISIYIFYKSSGQMHVEENIPFF